MSTSTCLPSSFAAGTSVEYTVSNADYPASSGWTMKLILAGKGKAVITATPNGDSFDVAIDTATSGPLPAGVYHAIHRFTNGSDVKNVAAGVVEVTPNLETASAGDLQPWQEKRLEEVEAAIAALEQKRVKSYQMPDRAVEFIDLPELRRERNQLRRALNLMKRGQGGQVAERIQTKFVRPR